MRRENFLQFNTVHAGHQIVEHQATAEIRVVSQQELFSRCIGFDREIRGVEHFFQQNANDDVVIDNIDFLFRNRCWP